MVKVFQFFFYEAKNQFITKQVITEAPDIPGRLRKHTDNSIVVSFAINIYIFFFCIKSKCYTIGFIC